MRAKSIFYCWLLATFAGPAAYADDLPVNLTLSTDQDTIVSASSFLTHPKVTLKGGPATISTQSQGTLFSSTFRLVTSDKNAIDFKAPKKTYVTPGPGQTLAISVPASATGQNMGLQGAQTERKIETWQEIQRHGCSYRKYTYSCGYHSSYGSGPKFECGNGYVTEYDKKDVIVTMLKVEKSFSGALVSADGNTMATIDGLPSYAELQTNEESASDCGGKATDSVRAKLKPHVSLVNEPVSAERGQPADVTPHPDDGAARAE